MLVYAPKFCGQELLIVVVNGGGQVERGFARSGDATADVVYDVIEAVVLGHAIAGLDIEGQKYREGIEAAMEGADNNL